MKALVLLLLFIASSECAFSKRWNIKKPGNPAYIPAAGKSFFACNEVARVIPQPHSFLACIETDVCEFLIEFVRPVKNILEFPSRWWSSHLQSLARSVDPSGHNAIFLTPDPHRYETRLHPYEISFADSHGKLLSALFSFRRLSNDITAIRRSLRTLFLVVDGGWYYTPMEEFVFPYHAYVPLSIFGEYYLLVDDARKENATVALHSSYCRDPLPLMASREPLPLMALREILPLASVFDGGDNLLITVDAEGHHLEERHNSLIAKVSITLEGLGTGSVALPSTIDVLYEGKPLTVALPPATKINAMRGYGLIEIPVKRELIYELRERILHYKDLKMVPLTHQPTYYRPDRHFPSYRLIREENVLTSHSDAIRVEFFDPNTQSRITEHIVLESPGDNLKTRTDYVLLRNMEDIDRQRTVHATRTASAFSPYLFEQHAARQDHTECHLCPPNSRRNYGRGGVTYHCAELGTFYHLLTPLVETKWMTSQPINISVTTRGETHIVNLTTLERIPSFLREAVQSYAVLVPPLGPWTHLTAGMTGTILHDLEDAIYIPINVVNNTGCNGLGLFKYPKNFSSAENFCDKAFGDCIGEPFHSTKRFPSLPPFGVPELAGLVPPNEWALLDARQQQYLNLTVSNGPLVWGPPHAVLRVGNHYKEDGSIVLSYAPRRISIATVDIPGVEVLEPILAVTTEHVAAADVNGYFCKKTWKLKALLNSTSHETEAIVSGTVSNVGKGGGLVTFELKCTSLLTVMPSTKQTSWVHAQAKSTVSFLLNAIRASDYIAVHKCHLIIAMETVSLFSGAQTQPPVCVQEIKTYGGAFEDPCLYAGIKPSSLQLAYYVLPPAQRVSSEVLLKQFFLSPGGAGRSLLKVINVVLSLQQDEVHLVSTIFEERISCRHNDVIVLSEDKLLHEALLALRKNDHRIATNVTVKGDFLTPRKLFYFGGRDWQRSQNTKEFKSSGCSIEIWTRTRRSPCRYVEKVREVFIPLSEDDLKAIEKHASTASKHWLLNKVYGGQQEELLLGLGTVVLGSVVLLAVVGLSHIFMYTVRHKIPTANMVRVLKQRMEKVEEHEKRHWENPRAFLSNGEAGPFYQLYDFTATEPFDTKNLQSLKVAGTLRCQDRELRVVFGHVTKVYTDGTRRHCNVWVEASSGMYLLEFCNVAPEYKDTLKAYLQKVGITIA